VGELYRLSVEGGDEHEAAPAWRFRSLPTTFDGNMGSWMGRYSRGEAQVGMTAFDYYYFACRVSRDSVDRWVSRMSVTRQVGCQQRRASRQRCNVVGSTNSQVTRDFSRYNDGIGRQPASFRCQNCRASKKLGRASIEQLAKDGASGRMRC